MLFGVSERQGQEISVEAFKRIGNALTLCADYRAVSQPVLIISPAEIEPTFKV